MSFILVPDADVADVQINAWNWRPTLALLRADVLRDEEHFQRLGAHGAGGELSAEECAAAAAVIERVLAKMKPGDRALPDGSVTSPPKSGSLDDPTLYSATFEWLARFVEFCRSCGGFKVY